MLARFGLICGLLTMGFSASSALAVENFIPRGHSYAPGNEMLPSLNSTEDRINLQTDLIETEIYVRQRERALFSSELNRFINSQNPDPTDNSIDY